jgi:hypothetical protein
MALGRCLEALRANQAAAAAASQRAAAGGAAAAPAITVVPYRVSKLTHLFRDALHGQGRMALLVALSPSPEDADETAQVLRYAATAAGITMQPAALRGPAPVLPLAAGPGDAERTQALTARVCELERELGLVRAELADASAALEAAEVDVRSEVVAEVGAVIAELRSTYEAALADAAAAVVARDTRIAELEGALQLQRMVPEAGVEAGVDTLPPPLALATQDAKHAKDHAQPSSAACDPSSTLQAEEQQQPSHPCHGGHEEHAATGQLGLHGASLPIGCARAVGAANRRQRKGTGKGTRGRGRPQRLVAEPGAGPCQGEGCSPGCAAATLAHGSLGEGDGSPNQPPREHQGQQQQPSAATLQEEKMQVQASESGWDVCQRSKRPRADDDPTHAGASPAMQRARRRKGRK